MEMGCMQALTWSGQMALNKRMWVKGDDGDGDRPCVPMIDRSEIRATPSNAEQPRATPFPFNYDDQERKIFPSLCFGLGRGMFHGSTKAKTSMSKLHRNWLNNIADYYTLHMYNVYIVKSSTSGGGLCLRPTNCNDRNACRLGRLFSVIITSKFPKLSSGHQLTHELCVVLDSAIK